MDRRRGLSNRPGASSEDLSRDFAEVQCWSQAATSLSNLSNIYANPATVEIIGKVNRLISAWPTDDTLPAEGIDGVKTISKKLASGLDEIKKTADAEAMAIDDAIEQLGILIALRKASEALPQEKRNKRPRPPSPAAPSLPSTPTMVASTRGTSVTAPLRSSVGPQPLIPFSREPKARREALKRQLPLQEGRKVAYHALANKNADGVGEADENTWILAVVIKSINQDKNRYEVQDAEPQEDGRPGMYYKTTLRSIIPLPDPNAPPTSAAHLNAYPEFSSGSTVMALYPDTSCFYRAEVISSPKDLQPSGRGAPPGKYVPTYKLKFEDDDDQEHSVAAQWVVEWPGS